MRLRDIDWIGWMVIFVLACLFIGLPVLVSYSMTEEEKARQLCEQRGGRLLRDRSINACIDKGMFR